MARAMALLGCLLRAGSAGAVEAPVAAAVEGEVTLGELVAFAERRSEKVRLAAARLGYAEAARAAGAPWLRENPSLDLALGPRFGGADQSELDFQAALHQPIEIAGQRGLRLEAASRLRARLGAEAQSARWDVRTEVKQVYRLALIARARVSLAADAAGFGAELAAIAERRLAAGEVGIVEASVARSDAARARATQLGVEQELRALELRLCEVSGWPIDTPPSVRAPLEPVRPVPPLKALLGRAERHPELGARRAATGAARAEVALADREAWPTPVLGVQVSREGSFGSPANYIVLGSVGLPLPVWQRNHGARERARADVDVAGIEEESTVRTLRVELGRAYSALDAASQRIALFASTVTPSLRENLSLLSRGFDAGELSALDVAVARERFLQAQSAALDAYADYYAALTELEGAVGGPLDASALNGGKP